MLDQVRPPMLLFRKRWRAVRFVRLGVGRLVGGDVDEIGSMMLSVSRQLSFS